ncbi:MAG TPA: hypothetical protein VGN81_07475, partial [Pseudonocardiaceae bacterium]
CDEFLVHNTSTPDWPSGHDTDALGWADSCQLLRFAHTGRLRVACDHPTDAGFGDVASNSR